ncbi:MAG: isoprenylcysteine carboxylmethyltransferase family protein [Kiritimatiellaeota bacterium]|nr:isoprenylcysteine carboxylmethyltransferase family protein [Kiritimatiellota bacterium]
MPWRERGINLIYRAATGGGRLRAVLTALGGTVFLSVLVCSIGLAFFLDRYFRLPHLCSSPWQWLIAAPLLAVGLWLWAWSFLYFLKARGTPVPFNPPPRLVTTGPYAYVRNPMLAGVFLLLQGCGLACNSMALTCFFGPLFVLIMLLELKWIEEPELEKRLGAIYTDYRRHVPMFIPRIHSDS